MLFYKRINDVYLENVVVLEKKLDDAVILIGALVHIPHTDFTTVLRNVTTVLKDNGLILVTVKEGTGTAESAAGRIFYLFQHEDLEAIFASLSASGIFK